MERKLQKGTETSFREIKQRNIYKFINITLTMKKEEFY